MRAVRKESSDAGVAFSELSSGSSAVTEGVFGRSSETGLAAFALRTSMYAEPFGPHEGGGRDAFS